jgi:hypothetical protein
MPEICFVPHAAETSAQRKLRELLAAKASPTADESDPCTIAIRRWAHAGDADDRVALTRALVDALLAAAVATYPTFGYERADAAAIVDAARWR